MNLRILFVILPALLLTRCENRQLPADMLITGTIYTADEKNPVVETVAVSGDKIVFAGKATEALQYKGKKTELIDLGSGIMTPGFIDGHAHLMSVGFNELNLNLLDIKSYDEMIEKVKEAVSKVKPGQWIIGRGWHQDKWEKKPDRMVKGFQTHHDLSKVSPYNPVFLSHASGHAAIANAKAMEIAGVGILAKEKLGKEKTVPGGEIIKDELGNPTGIFTELAMGLVSQHIPENDPATDQRALELALQACLRNGLTGFHDAGASREHLRLFYQFKNEGKLPVRLYVMLTGWDRQLIHEWYKKGPDIDSAHFLTVRSIKMYSDGALGSRTAWLLEPYTDQRGTEGMPVISMDTIAKSSAEALRYGFQLCTHAIGDRANREILGRYEMAFREFPEKTNHRFRIEHAQHIHPDDIPRFGKSGVIPAMQAIHMSSDRPWAIERLGEKRIVESAYVWQSLLRTGARIVNGTDAPVEPLNPLGSFYAAVTRKTLTGTPEGGYEPSQKMSREQALRSYTLDAAYGEFGESFKGSIEVGKAADFTIFSRDIMTINEADILKTQVEMTIVGGKVMYKRK